MADDRLRGPRYVFSNRERGILQGPAWERNGFWTVQRRHKLDRFPWRAIEEQALEIDADGLRMLRDGTAFWHALRAYVYEPVP